MAVIPFPDRHSPAAPVRNIRELSNVIHANEGHGRTVCVENNDAVRRFALSVAAKLLSDRELNQAAPFMIDRIVRLLMTESKNS